MPHTTVEYSDQLADAFDRQAFGRALHPLVARTLDISVERCRTRFWRVTESVLGDGTGDGAMIRIVVGLLPGRSAETRAPLTRAILELAREHLRPAAGRSLGLVHVSVDIQDLDAAYVMRQQEFR